MPRQSELNRQQAQFIIENQVIHHRHLGAHALQQKIIQG
jgi:hypothetical protein